MNKVALYAVACKAYMAYLDQPDGDFWQDFPDAGVEANVFDGSLVLDNDSTVYITLYPYDPAGHVDKPLAYYYFDGMAVVEDDRE